MVIIIWNTICIPNIHVDFHEVKSPEWRNKYTTPLGNRFKGVNYIGL